MKTMTLYGIQGEPWTDRLKKKLDFFFKDTYKFVNIAATKVVGVGLKVNPTIIIMCNGDEIARYEKTMPLISELTHYME